MPAFRGLVTASTIVLLLRVLLLLSAAGLAVAAFVLAARGPSAVEADLYVCPMHAEVVAKAPGQCPICKMALEREGSAAPAPASSSYSCPMHPEVTKQEPGRCHLCGMDLRPTAPAPKPKADEATLIPTLSSRYAPGVTWLPETFPPAQAGKPGDHAAVATLKRRAFVDGVRAPAWLETPERLAALLYEDELVGVSADDRGIFFSALAPRSAIEVRPSPEAPTPWDASTSVVRFAVEPGAAALRAGEVGWLTLPPERRELLSVPESALLRSSEGPYVLVPRADAHGFSRRRVQIGRALRGQVIVQAGLQEGEQVVIQNAFFLDAEQRAPAAEPFAEVRR